MGLGIDIYKNDKFGEIRVSGTRDLPLFCLSDICRILCIGNPSQLKKYLRQDGVISNEVEVVTGKRLNGSDIKQRINMTFVNESNLYKIFFQSRKEEAEQFQEWVTGEILPTIRKKGGYINDTDSFVKSYFEDLDENTKTFLTIILDDKKRLLEQNKKQKEIIKEQMPKVEFFNSVADSKHAVSMNDVSKILAIKGYGRNNLFEFLRGKKVLMNNNRPYQRYIDSNYFRVIEQHYQKNGEECITFKTLVYQTGINYIRKLIGID